MNCTEELLKTIEEDAFCAMTPSEIARHIKVDADVFKAELMKESSPLASSYRCGQVKAIKLAKQQIQEQAKVGNPPALEMFMRNLTEMMEDEIS